MSFDERFPTLSGAPIYFGGPCGTPGVLLIHGHIEFKADMEQLATEAILAAGETPGQGNEPIVEVTNGLWLGSPETYDKILETYEAKQRRMRFIAGDAGWGAGQLEAEIENGAWKILEADPEVIFDTSIWDRFNPSQLERWKPSLN